MTESVLALPKADLHVHLEGCLEAELLFALAERNDLPLPWSSVEELRAAYTFDGLASFLALYFQGCQVLVTEQDFYDLTRAHLERAHTDGVMRVEAFLGPQSFTDRGVPMSAILGGTLRAMADSPVSAALIVSTHRHRSEADAFALLEQVQPWGAQIAGWGMGGAEVGHPPSLFSRWFAELRHQGFRTCVHAGEEGPASYVREALEDLQVDRIDHGLAAMQDPALVRDLAAAQTPLTVCPLSNVVLHVTPSLAEHPLRQMLDAGLMVTVNSDDPAYFGGHVTDNLVRTQAALGLSDDEVREIAANGILASFQPDEVKATQLRTREA